MGVVDYVCARARLYITMCKWSLVAFRSCIRTRGFECHGGHHCGAWPLTGSWCRSGEGGPGGLVLVPELKSKRRGRRRAEVEADRASRC